MMVTPWLYKSNDSFCFIYGSMNVSKIGFKESSVLVLLYSTLDLVLNSYTLQFIVTLKRFDESLGKPSAAVNIVEFPVYLLNESWLNESHLAIGNTDCFLSNTNSFCNTLWDIFDNWPNKYWLIHNIYRENSLRFVESKSIEWKLWMHCSNMFSNLFG